MLRRVMAGLVVAGSVGMATPAVAAPSQVTAQPAVVQHGPARFDGLTELMIQRIVIGDDVAASKYFSGKPVDDPVREQQIIESVRQSAVQLGIDPDSTEAFFRGQIEASKVVQRGLLAYWAAHPDKAPTTGPDLNVIREKLDALTTQLLAELVRDDHARHAGLACDISLLVATATRAAEHHFDRLHRQALAVAAKPVCQ